MHVFLTGSRNVGKTTIINNILENLSDRFDIGGFVTFMGEEFEPGKNYVYISRVDSRHLLEDLHDDTSKIKIALRDKTASSFTAYPKAFDDQGVDLLKDWEAKDLVIADELGFMESDAFKFQEKIFECLDGHVPILGVIKPKSGPFLDAVRSHRNVYIIEVTKENRDTLEELIIKKLRI